ncbi:nSTAND1 domain-containing NTPase [Cellulomonas sp. P5_C6]
MLGPLEVWTGTNRLEVGGRQERALLALLLTAPGRVFSVPAITAGLWGERPPGGADNTVMTYVSRLRRALPDGVATALVTRRPGYVLSIEPAQVDAELFRALVGRGHRELGVGRPELAAGSLREALGLWRGDAYAEFDAPFAVAERRALDELRLAAFEDRASAELDVGEGPDLIAELEAVVSEHPLRERLWAQLMTALYRSGRQGDALRAYQRARDSLVDELGVEPGDELRDLQALVLAHDPRLLGPAHASRSRRDTPLGPGFVGRARDLALLDEAYGRAAAGSPVRILVTGPHGMGKTRLLAEAARRVRAAGGTVADEPSQIGAHPGAAPVLLVLDGLERSSVADLVELSEAVTARVRPALVVGACVWDELSPEQASALAELFADRLPLVPLSSAEATELVELYVPRAAVAQALAAAEVVASAGVPLHLHAAASRFGEKLLAERIGTSAQAIADPRRQLAQSRAEVADGVIELSRLRSLRQAHAIPDSRRRLCPYKGLAYYDVDDAPYFAGREPLVARLVARLVDARLLAVVGASGSGKSSVVRAGVVPAINDGLLPGSERWHVVVTTPSRQAPDLPPAGGPRTLLVVDQLEELFTVLPPEEQTGYAEWITAAAERDDVTVVAAIRSDYFARVVVHRELADLLAANTVLVGPMSAEELRQAVEVPAAAADLTLEPGLAATIADDVVGEPGGLPLMSTALLSLWERGDGRRLSLADYRVSGGVRTAVARLAEAAYAPMTPTQQAHARRILLRLAEVDDAGEPVRRRVALSELSVDDDPDARTALETLAARRLLTVSATHAEVAHEALLREWPRLRGWLDDDDAGRRMRRHLVPAAAAWDSSARDPGELYRGQRLAAALDFEVAHGDDLTDLERDFLRAGTAAADADAAGRRRSHRRLQALAAGLAVVLLLALGAGWVAVDRRSESARLAVAADVRALRAAALGEDRWDLALLYAAQAYRADRSPQSQAALLRTVQRSPEATAMYSTGRRLQALAVSADGQTLAALGSAGTVFVWDLATGAQTSTVPGLTELAVSSLDLSPDGRYIAVVGIPVDAERYGFLQQLMVVDLDQVPTPIVRTWEGPGITSARFTADGRTVATVGIDGLVREVDVRTGQMAEVAGLEATVSDLTALDASAGRRFMASADPQASGRVTAWSADDGRVVWSSDVSGGAVVSINPAGTALVLAHTPGPVEHLDLVTGVRRAVPSDPAVGLVDLDWAPDGSSFVGATTEGTVVLWDAATLEQRSIFRGHSGTVSQVVHSADGARLYASGFDGAVVVWDLTGTRGVVRRASEPTPAQPFGPFLAADRTLSADGSLAVSYLEGGALELVDVGAATTSVVPVKVTGSPARVVADPAGRYAALLTVQWPANLRAEIQVVDVTSRRVLPNTIHLIADFSAPTPAFSGDGRSLVTADAQSVAVWDVQSGLPAAGRADYEAGANVVSLAPDETGHLVAVGVVGGGVEIADMATGALVTELVPPGGENLAVAPLGFSPDGRWLAGGSESGRVVVWDTAAWDVRRTVPAVQGGGVDSLAFTPDSRAVVVGGAGTASVWDVDPGAATGMTLALSAVPSRSDVAVATRDDGRAVVTLTDDGGVQLWAISPQALLEQACAVAGRNLSPAEWGAVLPNLPYAPTCPEP